MVDYKIISTGSKGNAVVIDNSILVDCGVPFRALAGVYRDLRLVLLTHIHGDHFNRATIRKLATERPTLRFGCCGWLAGDLLDLVEPRNIDVYDIGKTFAYAGLGGIRPLMLAHNAPNCAYCIGTARGEFVFYATDTNNMDGIEAKNYGLYLIEANYSGPEIVERIRRKQEAGEYCHEWDVLENHLSREKAEDWLYANMGSNSRYVFLHQHEERGIL